VANALPGEVFTFQVLFLGPMGTPITPPNPSIEVLAFTTAGAKNTLVAAGTPMTPVSGDPGRYAYVYNVPGAWLYQPTMYGVMHGTDPDTSAVIVVEMEVNVVQGSPGPACRGLVANFVRGG